MCRRFYLILSFNVFNILSLEIVRCWERDWVKKVGYFSLIFRYLNAVYKLVVVYII